MIDLPQVTEAQIVAAQLRTQAARLVLLAEQLEATAPKQPRRKKQPAISLVEMVKQAGEGEQMKEAWDRFESSPAAGLVVVAVWCGMLLSLLWMATV